MIKPDKIKLHNYNYILNIVLITVFLFITGGCKTAQTPSCLTDKQKGLIIRWGDYDNEKKEFNGYLLNTDAEYFSVKGGGLIGKHDEELLGTIDSDNYCKLFHAIRKEFLATQTLNSPGDISRIIEFNNPTTNVILRAVWNPKFQTFGSKGFRKIYDQLQDILKNDK